MENTITARLLTPYRFVVDEKFPFYDLPVFLKSLSPKRIEVCFYKSVKQEFVIYLALTFSTIESIESISIFKETLLRSEPELGIDCTFSSDKTFFFENLEWNSIQIQPDQMMLPSGNQIAITIPLIEVAINLFRQAIFTNSSLCYKLKLELATPDPENARKLVPALAELEVKRSIPALKEAVKLGFNLLSTGGWTSQEEICFPDFSGAFNQSRIEILIKDYIKTQIGFIPETVSFFQWNNDKTSSENNILQKKVSRLRKSDFLEKLFHSILPSDSSCSVIMKSLEDARRLHGSPSIQGDYAFISYSHVNLNFVNSLIRHLDTLGVRYWYDTKIPAGKRWDEELENKIRNAGILIACVSDAYQESKYCKRELKFADLIGKVIMPIASSKWKWGNGLQMMFQELQIASFNESQSFNDYFRELQSIAPQIFTMKDHD